MLKFPSPAMCVALASMIVALGGAGYSATGGNFILGKANSAATQTRLVTPLNGAAFRIDNTSSAAAATGMNIITNAARPPLAVNSSVKVANLNADKLDGLDSALFPRKLAIPFNLAPGAISAPIVLPLNQPVFVMGVTTTADARGVGHATLLRALGIEPYITWVGLESVGASPKEITVGQIGFTGAHIVHLDYSHTLDIEVDNAVNGTIRIHNENASARAGVVTLLW